MFFAVFLSLTAFVSAGTFSWIEDFEDLTFTSSPNLWSNTQYRCQNDKWDMLITNNDAQACSDGGNSVYVHRATNTDDGSFYSLRAEVYQNGASARMWEIVDMTGVPIYVNNEWSYSMDFLISASNENINNAMTSGVTFTFVDAPSVTVYLQEDAQGDPTACNYENIFNQETVNTGWHTYTLTPDIINFYCGVDITGRVLDSVYVRAMRQSDWVNTNIYIDNVQIIGTQPFVYFQEDFGTSGFTLLANNLNQCVQAPSLPPDYLAGDILTNFENDWYCGYGNPPFNAQSDISLYAIDGALPNEGVCYSNDCFFSQIEGTDPLHHHEIITYIPPPYVTVSQDDYLSFYCWNFDAENQLNSSHYIGFGETFTNPFTDSLWISLQDGGCDWSGAYAPDWMLSPANQCVELFDILGYDCDATNSPPRKFTVPMSEIATLLPSFDWSKLDEMNFVTVNTQVRAYNVTDEFTIDDIEFFSLPTPVVDNLLLFEDFEDMTLSTGDFAPPPAGTITYTGSVENPNYDMSWSSETPNSGSINDHTYFGYSSTAYSGTKSARMFWLNPDNDDKALFLEPVSQVIPDGTTVGDLNLSFYMQVFGSDTPSTNFYFEIQFYNGLSLVQSVSVKDSPATTDPELDIDGLGNINFPMDGAWHKVTFNDFSDPSPVTHFKLLLYKYALNSDFRLYIDDLRLELVNVTPTTNQYPVKLFSSVVPSEGDESTTFEFTIALDDPEDDQIRVGIDCDGSGVPLTEPPDHFLQYYPLGTGLFSYNCSYAGLGLPDGEVTAVWWVSDSEHEFPPNAGAVNFYETITLTSAPILNGSTNFFEESFGTTAFSYDEAECTTHSPTTTGLQGFADPMDFGNNTWGCWMDDKGFNYISFENTNDVSKINTPEGLHLYSSSTALIGQRHRKIASWIDENDNFFDIDLAPDDYISFTCQINDQAYQMDAFLTLGYWDDEFLLLSLGADAGDGDRCALSGLPDAYCCQLADIVGESGDCKNTVKTNVQFTVDQLTEACAGSGIGHLDFLGIEEVGLWIVEYDLAGYSHMYFDDLRLYEQFTYVNGTNITEENNTVPNLVYMDADPNPANVSETVTWTFQAFDDDLQENLWTAFDCDTSVGGIDYPYMLNRPVVASKRWEVTCSYGTTGIKTAKAYVSDVAHYPVLYDTMENTVQVILEEGVDDPRGGDCVGFVAPVCAGDCAMLDDFSYTGYPVTCNDWEGTDKQPKDGAFWLGNIELGENGVDRNFDWEIHDYEYNSAYFSFDWRDDGDTKMILTMGDATGSPLYELVYLYWDNGYLYSLDTVTPYVTNLGAYTKGVDYGLSGVIDFEAKTIEYTVFGNINTVEFFEQEADTLGDIDITWDNYLLSDFTIDNIYVQAGEPNENGTAPDTGGDDYEYDADFFCAIDWTQDPAKFSEENCLERGYNMEGSLAGLCMPRACLSDIGGSIFNWATKNILVTIVMVTALILIAPLFIAMGKKRR